MYAKYKLKNGKLLSVYLTEDILNNNLLRTSTGAYELDENGFRSDSNEIEIYLKIDKSRNLFFEYEGEKIYFKDYEYMTTDQLIEYIDSCDEKWKIFDDDVLATFLKDTDNVGLICELNEYDGFALFVLGIGMTSSNGNKRETLCIPTEKRYEKANWGYKITIEAADENLRSFYAGETYYFSDFVSSIKRGNIKLVNLKTYDKNQEALLKKEKK